MSWFFGHKIRSARLLPSFGTVGDGPNNAMMESFWSSMQIELLDPTTRKTRVELANAIFECIEIFHNRQRRHPALGSAPRSDTRHSISTASLPRVSGQRWDNFRAADRLVIYPCSRPCGVLHL